MRQKQRLVTAIKIASKTSTKNAIGESIPGWGTKVDKAATVLPLSSQLDIQMYGERVKQMKRLICDGLVEGMGVWLSGETGANPVWIVTSVEKWPQHEQATIERQV